MPSYTSSNTGSNKPSDKILYLSEQDVAAVLSRRDVIDTVEETFRQAGNETILLGNNSFLSTGDGKMNRFIAMPVSIPQQNILGLKWINIYDQPAAGYPFSHGNLVIVNDTDTGSPLAIVSATNITTMRTAGGHGVIGAKYLAKKDPRILCVIGCGGQGRNGVGGFLEQFPSLREIRLYDAYPASCEAIARQYQGQAEFKICPSPEAAVRQSDIVLTCSSSRDILVEKDWIEKGMTLISINAFHDLSPEVTELADKWVLGMYQEDDHNILANPDMSHGMQLNRNRVYAQMPEIISGQKPGRETEDEIILYSHMGMGAFDVACAHIAYKRALEKGMGVSLEV